MQYKRSFAMKTQKPQPLYPQCTVYHKQCKFVNFYYYFLALSIFFLINCSHTRSIDLVLEFFEPNYSFALYYIDLVYKNSWKRTILSPFTTYLYVYIVKSSQFLENSFQVVSFFHQFHFLLLIYVFDNSCIRANLYMLTQTYLIGHLIAHY